MFYILKPSIVAALYFLQLVCSSNVRSTNSEAAAIKMAQLLEWDEQLVNQMTNYVNIIKSKIPIMRRYITQLHSKQAAARPNREQYLSNPLQSYSLLRHMKEDWQQWHHLMKQAMDNVEIDNIRALLANMPRQSDYENAQLAILQIQRVYNVTPQDFSQGIVAGVHYNLSFSPLESLEMAQLTYDKADTVQAEAWLDIAFKGYNLSDDVGKKIYDVLGFHTKIANRLHANAAWNNKNYLKAIKSVIASGSNSLVWIIQMLKRRLVSASKIPGDSKSDCFMWCNTTLFQKPSRLHCHFGGRSSSPYMTLAPFKMETLSLKPLVLFYHDILYEHEMLQLRQSSKDNNHSMDLNNWGTLHAAVLSTNYSRVTQRITRIIKDMGDFDTAIAKELQIINYGLDGHCKAHHNFINSTLSEMHPDPLATALFYLSDVELGGATVLPNLHIAVQPKKGGVLIWNNLNNILASDDRTYHMNCPVLKGSKWVLQTWINRLTVSRTV